MKWNELVKSECWKCKTGMKARKGRKEGKKKGKKEGESRRKYVKRKENIYKKSN